MHTCMKNVLHLFANFSNNYIKGKYISKREFSIMKNTYILTCHDIINNLQKTNIGYIHVGTY